MANLESTFPIFPPAVLEAAPNSNPHALERETQYIRRIRDLEEELRQSRIENEKNVKFPVENTFVSDD